MLKNIPDYPQANITGFLTCVFTIGNYYGGLFYFVEHSEPEIENKEEQLYWTKFVVHIIDKSNTSKTARVSLQKQFSPYEHFNVTFNEDKIIYVENLDDYNEEEELFYKTDKLYETVVEVDENEFLKKAIEIVQEKYDIDEEPLLLWLNDEEIKEFYPKELNKMEIADILPENLTMPVSYFYVNEVFFECRVNSKSDLRLNRFELDMLPNSLKYMTFLKRLSINENFLQNEIKEIVYLKDLEFLEIRDNLLSELPDKIGELKNLQELIIKERFLNILPSSLGELKQLRKLTIENTSLTRIPEEIGQLENLEELMIVENKNLETLPQNLCKLKKLTHLYLYSNELRELPENINALKNLKVLHLEHNKLQALPKTIFHLENLEELNIGYNNIEPTPSNMFKKYVEIIY